MAFLPALGGALAELPDIQNKYTQGQSARLALTREIMKLAQEQRAKQALAQLTQGGDLPAPYSMPQGGAQVPGGPGVSPGGAAPSSPVPAAPFKPPVSGMPNSQVSAAPLPPVSAPSPAYNAGTGVSAPPGVGGATGGMRQVMGQMDQQNPITLPALIQAIRKNNPDMSPTELVDAAIGMRDLLAPDQAATLQMLKARLEFMDKYVERLQAGERIGVEKERLGETKGYHEKTIKQREEAEAGRNRRASQRLKATQYIPSRDPQVRALEAEAKSAQAAYEKDVKDINDFNVRVSHELDPSNTDDAPLIRQHDDLLRKMADDAAKRADAYQRLSDYHKSQIGKANEAIGKDEEEPAEAPEVGTVDEDPEPWKKYQ